MQNLLQGRGAKNRELTVGKEPVHQDVLGVAIVAVLLLHLHPTCTAANVGLHPG